MLPRYVLSCAPLPLSVSWLYCADDVHVSQRVKEHATSLMNRVHHVMAVSLAEVRVWALWGVEAHAWWLVACT